MHPAIASPFVPTGRIKAFGPIGPRYEVGEAIRQLGDGDWLVGVTLVETGERVEYRLTHLNDDPDAL